MDITSQLLWWELWIGACARHRGVPHRDDHHHGTWKGSEGRTVRNGFSRAIVNTCP